MNDADHALKEIAAEEIDEVDIIMEDINDEIADLQESITNSSLTLSSSTGSLPGGIVYFAFLSKIFLQTYKRTAIKKKRLI